MMTTFLWMMNMGCASYCELKPLPLTPEEEAAENYCDAALGIPEFLWSACPDHRIPLDGLGNDYGTSTAQVTFWLEETFAEDQALGGSLMASCWHRYPYAAEEGACEGLIACLLDEAGAVPPEVWPDPGPLMSCGTRLGYSNPLCGNYLTAGHINEDFCEEAN